MRLDVPVDASPGYEQFVLRVKSAMAKHLIDLTQSIIGFPRHLSQHVGDLPVGKEPIEFVSTKQKHARQGKQG